MSSWIPYNEGEYRVEEAFLHVSSGHGLRVTEVVVEIYDDGRGKNLRGYGQVVNALLVDLLDWGEEADLILALAPGHRYRLPTPVIRAGKVFAPDVRSAFHFQPRSPWTPLGDREFERLVEETVFLNPS
ncbi:MAG TPA: hypothetical protein ENF48_09990 [Desulfobacteraceae bacterium]|nr:hypothetical protein [Deltaproteobacteria bacterium]RLB97983.1 MAG: hypothetical protein DRH76_03645 [Deltaproteobacteria bacterium]HDI60659.1 hypothetical protein [Desulfobacteraceae bacterium]